MSTEYLTGVSYIELTQGRVAIVDDWVAPQVSQFSWHFHNGGYANRGVYKYGKKHNCLMHRFVWETVRGEIPLGLVIDHINGDGLDNRLCNLRLADTRLNSINSSNRRMGLLSSNYPGAVWDKYRSNWQVNIRIGGKSYKVGRFLLEEDAAAAYWKALENWEEKGELPHKRRNL